MCEDVIDDIIDIVDDVIDGIIDIIADIGDFLFGWLIPDMPDMPDLSDLMGDGILVNKRSTMDALPVVYGTRKLGGNIVWLATTDDNQYLYIIVALCEGEVAKFTELYLDDQLYATYSGSDATYGNGLNIRSSSNLTSPTPTTQPINTSGLSINQDHPMYSAVETIDEVDTTIYPTEFFWTNGIEAGYDYNNNFDGENGVGVLGWTSAHLGKNINHAIFRFKYNSDSFNRIPKIGFVTKGKLINTNLNGTSYAYSNNPALCLHDYLINSTYGKGLNANEIDTASFITAQGICNTDITPYAGASNIKLFQANVALGSNSKLIDNVKMLLSSMRSFFTFSGGLYKLKVEGTGSSVLSINEDMIIGQIKVTGETKQSKYNRVTAKFDNEFNNYMSDEVTYPPTNENNVGSSYKYATMLSNDNDEELHFEMLLPATTNPYIAEDIAELVLKRSRGGLKIAFATTSEAQNLSIGDIISVTHSGLGFSNNLYIVTNLTLTPNGEVAMSGVEYDANVYTYNTKLPRANLPTTFLPNPKIVGSPTITSITDEMVNIQEGNIDVRMTVTFKGTSDYLVDKYEVVYKKTSDSTYKSAGISSGTQREILNVESGVTYNVKVRSINSLGYKSAYTTATHEVVGATEPPASVTNFSIDYQDQIAVLTWTPNTDLDLAYYHIRYSPDTAHSYPNTTVLVEKVSPPANSVTVPAKAGIYFIKAFDLLGHESTTETSVIGTISEFQGQVLATTITEETSFSGTHSNTVPVDGALILDSSGNFDSFTGNFDDAVGLFDAGTGVVSSGTYTFANQISLSAKYQGRVSSFLNIDYLDYINNFDSMAGNFDSVSGLFDSAGSTVDMDAKLLIATSDNNSTYTAFRPFQDGNYAFRYARFKINLTSNVSSATPKVNNCQVRLFMGDRTEKEQNVASGAGTKAITFSNAFFAEPSVIIMAQNAAQNIQTAVTSKSATGFSVTFTNAGGSAQNITFDYVATGQGRAI